MNINNDPDFGLELRKDFADKLRILLSSNKNRVTSSAEDVAQRLGLIWIK